MPLYEYKCDICGSVSEMLQKVNDPPMTKCIHCGGHVHKIISSSAIQFKGSGWYITDYTKKNMAQADTPPAAVPDKKPKKAPKKEQKQAEKN